VIRLRFSAVATVTLACSLLAGCAAERIAGMKPATPRAAAQTALQADGCRFTVKAIDDRREHASLGSLGRTQVGGEGFADWFASGIAAIPAYTSDEAPIALRIEVLKAYIQGLATLKSANLVVRVQVDVNGAPFQSKTYRGVDGSINWANTESEIQAAFDSALAHLRLQMGTDLDGLCKR
jgi:hypothetical protein